MISLAFTAVISSVLTWMVAKNGFLDLAGQFIDGLAVVIWKIKQINKWNPPGNENK